MKRFKKFLAILLVASMIFTINSVSILADGHVNESESYESVDDKQEETLDKYNNDSEKDELKEEEQETAKKLGSGDEQETEESTEKTNGIDLQKKNKDSDDLYGYIGYPQIYIFHYYISKEQVEYSFVSGDQYTDANSLEYVSKQIEEIGLPPQMTLKGFHKVSEEDFDNSVYYDVIDYHKTNYSPDGTVDFENLASIQWSKEHDMILYAVYDFYSFNILYLDEQFQVKTQQFDIGQSSELENFLNNCGTDKFLKLETDEGINGYTGEAENQDYLSSSNILTSYEEWEADSKQNVYWGAYYNFTKTVESVEIITEQNKKEYTQGQSFDGTGMIIHVNYDNGEEENISYNTDFSFEPSVLNTIGDEIEVKVIYEGVTSSNSVMVKVKEKSVPNNKSTAPRNIGGTSRSSGSDSSSVSAYQLKIPTYELFINSQLIQQLTYDNINDSSMYKAQDIHRNVGYGRWFQIGKTPSWYFLAYDYNQGVTTQPLGFLANGWYKVDWDGIEKWYHFDSNGVMQIGWYQDGTKTYFLENDLLDNWYGNAVTGIKTIEGKVYNFDSTGALIN